MIGENDVLDARRAGELLGLHEETMRRLAREGKIPAFKVGGVWRFNKSSLHRWAESQSQRQPPRKGRKTVLIVDDDEYVCDSVGRTVEEAGFRVLTASGGSEAVELMRGQVVPDLVLLDLVMPDMDGPTTLKEIRKAHGAIPVIVLTGYPESDLVAETLDYCPVTLVAKPPDPAMLVRTVRAVLNGVGTTEGEGVGSGQ